MNTFHFKCWVKWPRHWMNVISRSLIFYYIHNITLILMKPTKDKITFPLLKEINYYYGYRIINVWIFFSHYILMKYEIAREIWYKIGFLSIKCVLKGVEVISRWDLMYNVRNLLSFSEVCCVNLWFQGSNSCNTSPLIATHYTMECQ